MKSSRLIILASLLLWECSTYKQNILLRTPEDFKSAPISKEILQAERNYVIQKNDLLRMDVYTNKGERIIDPNPQLSNSTGTALPAENRPTPITYLVDLNGIAKFPVIGDMKLEGLTLRQAEMMLQDAYEKFFTDSYVMLNFQNKRVVVLGAPTGQVIPLNNQNVTLAEVIAMAKGFPNDSKSNNIRIVRGEKIFLVDLSTLEGFQAGNMIIEPGDIIYVEPVRRPFAEGLRDYTGLISLFVSALSLVIVIRSIK